MKTPKIGQLIKIRTKSVADELRDNPRFSGDPEAQAAIIMAGLGDCSQCGGYGCSWCKWTGEESGHQPADR